MRTILVASICTILTLLSLLHLFWAAGGRFGAAAAVPSINGVAAFRPLRGGTVVVAVALLLAGALVAAADDRLPIAMPSPLTTLSASVLAAVFLARAVGNYRFVGFFKSRGDGSFAKLDTLVYSPLCLALGISVLWIVWAR